VCTFSAARRFHANRKRAKEIDTFRNIKRRRHLGLGVRTHSITTGGQSRLRAAGVCRRIIILIGHSIPESPSGRVCVCVWTVASRPVVRCEPESASSGFQERYMYIYMCVLTYINIYILYYLYLVVDTNSTAKTNRPE